MPSKKQYQEIRTPRNTKLGRGESTVGGLVIADNVIGGERLVVVKMPLAAAPKKASKPKPVQKKIDEHPETHVGELAEVTRG